MKVSTLASFVRSCITIAILKLVEGRESGVYSTVNENFEAKSDAKRALLDGFFNIRRGNLY